MNKKVNPLKQAPNWRPGAVTPPHHERKAPDGFTARVRSSAQAKEIKRREGRE